MNDRIHMDRDDAKGLLRRREAPPRQVGVRRSNQGLIRSARLSSLTQAWDDGGILRLL